MTSCDQLCVYLADIHIPVLSFQRVASLCRILGHNEVSLNRALNMLSSSESMDFRARLMSDSGIKSPQNTENSRKHLVHEANHLQPDADGHIPHRESDTESGFEENGSQMTRFVQKYAYAYFYQPHPTYGRGEHMLLIIVTAALKIGWSKYVYFCQASMLTLWGG